MTVFVLTCNDVINCDHEKTYFAQQTNHDLIINNPVGKLQWRQQTT